VEGGWQQIRRQGPLETVEERSAGTSGLAAGRVRVQGLGLRVRLPEFEELPLVTTLERGWATCRLGDGEARQWRHHRPGSVAG
jgi:hypothetical protein